MLNQNFKEMLVALNEANVEYLVVGAYAMAAHGCLRSTGDIDFWVHSTPSNAGRVWTALARFGAPMQQICVEDFSTPELVFQIGIAPQRIDILTSISGVDFEQAWPQRLEIEIEGLTVNVIGLEHLLKNKVATGRSKDLIDAEILRNAGPQ